MWEVCICSCYFRQVEHFSSLVRHWLIVPAINRMFQSIDRMHLVQILHSSHPAVDGYLYLGLSNWLFFLRFRKCIHFKLVIFIERGIFLLNRDIRGMFQNTNANYCAVYWLAVYNRVQFIFVRSKTNNTLMIPLQSTIPNCLSIL